MNTKLTSLLLPALLLSPMAMAGSSDAPVLTGTPSAFIDRLKQAPSRIEDIDHKPVDESLFRLKKTWKGNRCSFALTNTGKAPIRLGNIILFDLAAHGLDPSTPIYGEGFQMLSQTAGTLGRVANLTPYMDGAHYRIPAPAGLHTVYGMMSFDLIAQGHVVLGFTSCNRFIGRFSFDHKQLRVSVDPEGLELAPGETWKLEKFIVLAGPDRNALLDQLCSDINRNHPPLKQPPLGNRAGWCTWYGVGGSGNQKIVTESAERFAKILPEIRFIQIDEGYTLEGDLLEVYPDFGDMKATIDAIRKNGFLPAIWVGPFVAGQKSHTLAQHPAWFVQGADGKPLVSDTVGFGGWRNGPWSCFDGSNPETANYLESVFKTMREKYGITYFKLDANYWGTIHSGRHFDPKATRIEAYRRGMEAVVRGAGPGAVILGCNAPMWPSLGLVNAMRTGNDIERNWGSLSSTARENLNRSWQNGRLWVCDPDCVVLAGNDSTPPNVWRFHATVNHAIGGLVLTGDKIETLKEEQLAVLRKLIPPTGRSARFENMNYEIGVTDLGERQYHYALNWGNEPVDRVVHLKQRSRLTDYWTGDDLGVHEGDYTIKNLPKQSATLLLAKPVAE